MAHFSNITSLAELKKQYRKLALANHPDIGGSDIIMTEINIEFEQLYDIWKDKNSIRSNNGYDDDYSSASASEYRSYVYNEYRWMGHNYNGQSNREIVDIIRNWLKETYPMYKFSVTRCNYNSIYVRLMKANFNPFVDGSTKCYHDVNHYWIDDDKDLNDRAKEVIKNVKNFVMSYNYDDSDAMVDYFCTNFYLTISVGSYKKPFELVFPKIKSNDSSIKVKKEKLSDEAKTIKNVMKDCVFSTIENHKLYGDKKVLGTYTFSESGQSHFYPNHYSSVKTANKRMQKLIAAGINCKMFRSCIELCDISDNVREIMIGMNYLA